MLFLVTGMSMSCSLWMALLCGLEMFLLICGLVFSLLEMSYMP